MRCRPPPHACTCRHGLREPCTRSWLSRLLLLASLVQLVLSACVAGPAPALACTQHSHAAQHRRGPQICVPLPPPPAPDARPAPDAQVNGYKLDLCTASSYAPQGSAQADGCRSSITLNSAQYAFRVKQSAVPTGSGESQCATPSGEEVAGRGLLRVRWPHPDCRGHLAGQCTGLPPPPAALWLAQVAGLAGMQDWQGAGQGG